MTLKKLIQKEARANRLAENKLRCFAINHFGDGQHPYAETSNLTFFKPAYVRECLLKCAASDKVTPQAQANARRLAEGEQP